jgi:tetratricopeptide (TPR) repeat protein
MGVLRRSRPRFVGPMPKPPASSSGRGRPPRPGGAKGRTPPRSRTPDRGDRPSEGPPWKRREADAERLKQAGWGGVARKGAGRMRDAGRGDASKAFRAAEPEGSGAWAPEQWIDEGEVRGEANRAVGRGRAPSKRRPPAEEVEPAADPSLGRAVAARSLERSEQRLRDASRAFNRERFDEARKILRPLAEAAPSAESVRELLGLTYYRLGRWKAAAAELEAFRSLTGSTEQHPVLADCYRALGRYDEVEALWLELREVSPTAELVAEGRIVYAGSLADRGDLAGAIAEIEPATKRLKRPQDHHLRLLYVLGDLHERVGDAPRARALFDRVLAVDPDFGDTAARRRQLS